MTTLDTQGKFWEISLWGLTALGICGIILGLVFAQSVALFCLGVAGVTAGIFQLKEYYGPKNRKLPLNPEERALEVQARRRNIRRVK